MSAWVRLWPLLLWELVVFGVVVVGCAVHQSPLVVGVEAMAGSGLAATQGALLTKRDAGRVS